MKRTAVVIVAAHKVVARRSSVVRDFNIVIVHSIDFILKRQWESQKRDRRAMTRLARFTISVLL
jgi:hypothetical protein